MTTTLTTTRLSVSGMDCASCASKIETAARRTPGIADATVSVASGTVTVRHRSRGDLDALRKNIRTMGYEVTEPGPEAPRHSHTPARDQADGAWWQGDKARLTMVCAGALALAFLAEQLVPALHPWGFILAIAVGLVPIARRAWSAARLGSPFSIETLMTVAALGAIVIGASEEAAVVIVLFLIGELLEGVAAGRARASIRALSSLVPAMALRDTGGQIETVPADRLALGDIVLVRPGDRIPADGEIVSGASSIDESPVTGESMPRPKNVGDPAFAGTINQDAALRIAVTATAADNTIARIIRLVEDAQEAKAPTERFIDRFSRYYTPAIMAVALLVAILPPLVAGAPWSEWVYKALALLLIGCPCALVISTPAAIAAALAAGARNGLLIKGGAILEGLGSITRIGFDKTGTLTLGKPVVTDIVAIEGDEGAILRYAAALEAGSSHPLAQAILERAREAGMSPRPADDIAVIGGKGIEGTIDGAGFFLGSPQSARERAAIPAALQSAMDTLQAEGKSISLLVSGGSVLGLIALRDTMREDARAALAELKTLNIDPVMLTGDNRSAADALAGELGIAAHAELLPQDKQTIVTGWREKGHRVAKIGDGINDAPALAAADIGIAMGSGTGIALETADAALLNNKVSGVPAMIRLSRAAMANIRQNIAMALGLKAVFLITTILGITGLWPAILADTGATVLVTANAIRLLAWRIAPSR